MRMSAFLAASCEEPPTESLDSAEVRASTTPVTSMSNTFPNFITEMCNFFDTGVVNVDPAETVSIMGIIEAGNKAIANPGVWINV